MIASVSLSAIGLFFSLNFVYSQLSRLFVSSKSRLIKKAAPFAIITILAFASLGVIFYDYLNYEIDPRAVLYTLIDDKDYNAMVFLKEYSIPSDFNAHHFSWEVISPVYPGNVIPAVSRKTAFSAIHYSPEEQNIFAKEFLRANCPEQARLIKTRRYSGQKYVYSYSPLNCIFLKEIFRNEKVYLYTILREVAKRN
jgi:hypothetical protein